MYQLTFDPMTILRIEDGAFIPVADENLDYRAYLEWLAEGNTPLPAPGVIVPLPAEVEMTSLRSVLIESDQDEAIEAQIRKLPGKDGKKIRAIWDGGGKVARDGRFSDFLRKDMGYTDQQVDDHFVAAEKYKP